MTTQNSVGNGLSGSTGTGSFVGGTAPTITLPAINNAILGYTTTATAAMTTTLTVNSNYQQYFTGSTTQTVLLPVTSTLTLGQSYEIINNSSGVVTVQSSGGNTIQAMAASTSLYVTCILTSGTTAASWNAEYFLESALTLPLSSTNGGSGVSNPTAHGIMVAEGSSPMTPIVLTAGQILIGTTSSDPTGATLTQGTGITITSATGSITIASNGVGNLVWNDVSGTSQAAVVNNGYIISNASQTTVTIPATAAEGSVFAVQGKGAAGWILQMNTGQTVHFGSSASTSAGSLTSTNQWDSVSIVCVTANTTFAVYSVQGVLTVA